jgi:hypothetical protein
LPLTGSQQALRQIIPGNALLWARKSGLTMQTAITDFIIIGIFKTSMIKNPPFFPIFTSSSFLPESYDWRWQF